MDRPTLPEPLNQLSEVVVPCLRRVYRTNAMRYDELSGDDSNVFGFCVYRNSWYHMEQDIADVVGWSSARPEGSLVVSGHGYSCHFYRFGQNERVDLNQFSMDQPTASLTKQQIVERNAQMMLDFGRDEDPCDDDPKLRGLVVVHAGNPEDACCGIWLGAPLPAEEILGTPWGWLVPLWLIDRDDAVRAEEPVTPPTTPHDELDEPPVEVTPLEDRPNESRDDLL